MADRTRRSRSLASPRRVVGTAAERIADPACPALRGRPPALPLRAAELPARSGAAGPEHPAPLGARGIGSQCSRARVEGAQDRRERAPGPRDRAVSSQGLGGKAAPPPQPPGARGRRGLQPGARVVSEPWRQLEFCVSGELAELVALCWEFRGYCGHPGEGSSLHLDRDATETSHRFLPSCEWSLPVRSGDGVCELDGISALSSSAFKQVPRL